MIYKNTSIKTVISKVMTDLDMQEESHRIADMIEWISEGLEKIGAFPQFEVKVAGKDGLPALKVTDYRAALPMGMHSIIQVAYSTAEDGPFYNMRHSTGSFEAVPFTTKTLDTDPVTYEKVDDRALSTSFTSDLIYSISPGYITTNQKSGYIMLSYNSIPLDEDGYPLIPDHISFIDALYWYVLVKLYYPMWKRGQIRDAVYYDARRSWNFYCKQAYGTAMMPDAGMLESIKNTWLRLVPDINSGNTFHSTLGEQQKIYIHNGN